MTSAQPRQTLTRFDRRSDFLSSFPFFSFLLSLSSFPSRLLSPRAVLSHITLSRTSIYATLHHHRASTSINATMTATGPSNFGPLTTIFTPPSWCSNERWIAHDSTKGGTLLRWGATCDSGTIGFASECYPDGWSGSNASALSYKGFSPGLACPSGFTGAASASHIEQSNHFVLSEYITDLGQHDLATACCPR